MHDLELHGGELRATICDGASASILHPDKCMLHSMNPLTNLIMFLAQSSNPCISLAGIESSVKLVCVPLDLIQGGWRLSKIGLIHQGSQCDKSICRIKVVSKRVCNVLPWV